MSKDANSDDDLDRILGLVAAAGADRAIVFALHLRPGAREWFFRYLAAHYPQLVDAYSELYRGSAYVARSYASDLGHRAEKLLRRHRLDGSGSHRVSGEDKSHTAAGTPVSVSEQPLLI